MDVVHFCRAGPRTQLPQSSAAEQRQRHRWRDRRWRYTCTERLSVSKSSEDPNPHTVLSWSSRPASQPASEGGRQRQSASDAKSDQPAAEQARRTQAGSSDPHQAASHPVAFLSRALPRILPPPLAQASASGLPLPQPEGAVLHTASEPAPAPGADRPRSFHPV